MAATRTDKPVYRFEGETFVIENYHAARPFASFLPGIAGEYGKPLWVFYTNRGQGISSFGVRNKDNALLEFYPANKAYELTSSLGFRTFFRVGKGPRATFYQPFQALPDANVRQTLRVRPHEIELEEVHRRSGLTATVVFFTAPNEDIPFLIRTLRIQNTGRRPLALEVIDELPKVVPFGLKESFLKEMSRIMEAFTEVLHVSDRLPFFKMKMEPSDNPEVQWIQGGFFAFALAGGRSQEMITDPQVLFEPDTSFQQPLAWQAGRFALVSQRLETLTPSAFSRTAWSLRPGAAEEVYSFYGQSDAWEQAAALRKRILKDAATYVRAKREENASLICTLTDAFAVQAGSARLNAYSRQTYLDNLLRGGKPFLPSSGSAGVFHYYTRKHGDMERDYNFFELAPEYFSQGNGNFRDVNQNRRSEPLLFTGIGSGSLQTFFNLIQLDGYNPLVIQSEKFFLEPAAVPTDMEAMRDFLTCPFSPGELAERLRENGLDLARAGELLQRVLSKAKKIQEASHGEGFWMDHWTYNLDLIESYLAVYPETLKNLWIGQRTFSYFDNEHVVQPRHKKYIRRPDGTVRQLHAVGVDREKRDLIRKRRSDSHKVRTASGNGAIYYTTLLTKVIGLLAVKASTLDPFGVGLEMEADKPGWCDALNGLPGLFGSSINESLELRRWVRFLEEKLPLMLDPGAAHAMPVEIADFLKVLTETLEQAVPETFFPTWEALCKHREHFREKTRFGVSGEEGDVSREAIERFLSSLVRVMDASLPKARQPNGLWTTYYIHEVIRYELLPVAPAVPGQPAPHQTVRVLEFKQVPVSPFLEGAVHALRIMKSTEEARDLYRAVKASPLYDRKLGMYRLNVPLEKESFEIGRNKIFTPGWLENESIFLHMAYKYMLETLRSGLAEEFFADLKRGLIAFQDPAVYGRSPLENSSFIASSRFPDKRWHGTGFMARLTGAAAEWISMVLYMGLGSEPYRWEAGQLRFEPRPTLAGWLFASKASDGFEKDTFGFKLFGHTWMIYRNPGRRSTFGPTPLLPTRFDVSYQDGRNVFHEGSFLPDVLARDLRDGKLSRVTVDLE